MLFVMNAVKRRGWGLIVYAVFISAVVVAVMVVVLMLSTRTTCLDWIRPFSWISETVYNCEYKNVVCQVEDLIKTILYVLVLL